MRQFLLFRLRAKARFANKMFAEKAGNELFLSLSHNYQSLNCADISISNDLVTAFCLSMSVVYFYVSAHSL